MAIAKRIVKVDISKLDEGLHVSAENVTIEPDRLIMRGAGFINIPHQTPVDIIIYYEDGIQFFFGEIKLSLPTQINVEILSVVSDKKERRRSLKVRTSFDASAILMFSMKERRHIRVNVPIRVRDLSMGGIGFFCNHPFFRRQKLILDMSYLKQDFKLEFQILRKEKIEAHMVDGVEISKVGFKFRYGGCILDISAEQERLITEYVFKVQLSEHQRRKEAE
jgi:c-di-GMP-binding flagellar brake protein YcgR